MEFFINPGIVKDNQRPAVPDSINDEFLLSKGLLNFRCKQKSSNKITTRPILLQYTIDKWGSKDARNISLKILHYFYIF